MIERAKRESFDQVFFKHLFAVEEEHFWFRSRNRIVAAMLKKVTLNRSEKYPVLEIGCGTGNVLKILAQVFPNKTVVGMDLFLEGLKYAKRCSSAVLVQGDMHQLPFKKPFEIIGLFDVLEHLPDDFQVLENLRGILRKNGVLLLTVPAHPMLWSYFDEASHHCRRYRAGELRQKLVQAGYEVEHLTQYMMSIFPMVWFGRHLSALRNRLFGRHKNSSSEELAIQEFRVLPIINEALELFLNVEGCWLALGKTLPFGTSIIAVARNRR